MHITSTINPSTNSAGDVCILLLSEGVKKVFVCKPRTYEKLEKIAREEFSLAEDAVVSFETSTLDICQGEKVRISKDAYCVMWQCLDSLSVIISGNARVDETEKVPAEASSSFVERTPFPDETFIQSGAPPAPRSRDHPDDVNNTRDEVDGDDSDNQPRRPRTKRTVPTRIVSTSPEDVVTHHEHDDPHDQDAQDDELDSDSRVEEPPSDDHEEGQGDSDAYNSGSPVEEYEERQEEEEEAEEEDNISEPPVRPDVRVVKQESLDDQDWEEARASGTSPSVASPSSKTTPAEIPRHARFAARKERVASTSAALSPNTLRQSINSPRKATTPVITPLAHIYPPRSQTIDSQDQLSQSSSQSATPKMNTNTPLQTNDQRFYLRIYYGDQQAEFKTRGRHTVRKLLLGACNQFNLDYDRANLVLELEARNGNGDIETVTSVCDPGMTLDAAGISDGAVLTIEMD